MRIAQVAPPWLAVPPKGYGGVELVVSLLADGLTERGHDVTLFATGDSTTKGALEYVFETAPGPKLINSIWHDTRQALLAYADPTRFDAFHLHSPFGALVAAAQVPTPTVHTLHGPFTREMKELYAQVADRLWFVAISERQRSFMPELRYAGVVYNGIDLSRYPYRDGGEKDDYVLFLGRTSPDKGALRAVRAAKLAGRRLVMAVKVADPEEHEHWRNEITPELQEGTEVHGEITHDEKVEMVSRARAVLFPIQWEEPFGLVMTEAMACGTPVIGHPFGAAPEVIADGETGFLVDTVEEIAERIDRVGEIDARACRERVETRFSKEAMVSGYERAFELALSSAG